MQYIVKDLFKKCMYWYVFKISVLRLFSTPYFTQTSVITFIQLSVSQFSFFSVDMSHASLSHILNCSGIGCIHLMGSSVLCLPQSLRQHKSLMFPDLSFETAMLT